MTNTHLKARELRAAGRLNEAITVYRTHLSANAQDRVAWHNLAAALGDAGHFDEAETACRRAQALGLDAAETWLVLGRALQALGRLDEAEAALEMALERKPDDAATHRDYAQLIWMRTGNADAALERFNASLRKAPNNLALQLALAHILGQVGYADQSLKVASDAARLAPGSAIVQSAAAYAACAAGAPEQALAYARTALALAPDDKAAGMAEIQALLALGEAQTAAIRVQALRPRFSNDQYILAMQTTAWRLLGDARYETVCDYTKFVRAYDLSAPEGWRSIEAYVSDLTDALNRRHSFNAHPFDQSVKGAGSQITHVEHADDAPALKAWPDAVLPALRDYLATTDRTPQLAAEDDATLIDRFQTWSVRLKRSGRHTDHVHPSGVVSSACHISTPSDLARGPDGWLRFGKPGIDTVPTLDAEFHHRPQAGVIVFFPSYIWHGVTPFRGEGARLSVAMDVAQK